jgi:hypothetical protein
MGVAGCAVVETVAADGTVERTSAFLAPVVVVDAAASPARAVRASGVGLGVGPNMAVLGSYRIAAVSLEPGCHIVIMPESELQVTNLRRLLGDDPNVCGVDR